LEKVVREEHPSIQGEKEPELYYKDHVAKPQYGETNWEEK